MKEFSIWFTLVTQPRDENIFDNFKFKELQPKNLGTDSTIFSDSAKSSVLAVRVKTEKTLEELYELIWKIIEEQQMRIYSLVISEYSQACTWSVGNLDRDFSLNKPIN